MIYNLSNDYEIPKFREQVEKMIKQRQIVELKRKNPARTLSQNSYLHLLISYFASEYGCTADEAKVDFFKRTCNRALFEETVINKRGHEIKRLRSTSSLTTGEMSIAIDRFRNWSSCEAGIYLPSANDASFIVHAQQEVERNIEYL